MIKLLVDISLSPAWVDVFTKHGWSVHWSAVGDPRAADRTVMAWARENGYVVFTHDLDFSVLLALVFGAAKRGSGTRVVTVLQIRTIEQNAQRGGAPGSHPPVDELIVVNSGLEDTMIVAYQELRDIRARHPAMADVRTAAFFFALRPMDLNIAARQCRLVGRNLRG